MGSFNKRTFHETTAKHQRFQNRGSVRPQVESLEERLVPALPTTLVAGTFSPGGQTHTIQITSIAEDANNDQIINLAESNSAAGTGATAGFDFTGTVTGPTAFHGGVTIELLDGSTSIASTPLTGAGTTLPFELSVPTASLGEGDHNLSLRVTRTGFPAISTNDSAGALAGFTLTVDTASTATIAPDLVAGSDSAGTHANSNTTDNYTASANPIVIEILGGTGGAEADATVTLQRDSGSGFVDVDTRTGPGTFNQTLADGSYQFRWSQEDSGGNSSGNSPTLSVTVDRTNPSGLAVALRMIDQSANGVTVTGNPRPNFEFTFTDQQGILTNNVNIALLDIDGTGPVVNQAVNIAPPATPVTGSLSNVNRTVTLTAATELAVGMHTANFRVTDDSGNFADISFNFEVVEVAGIGAPHTPVFTTAYDLFAEVGHVQPWQTSFDPTTQTTWFSTEDGNQIINFDPSTGAARIFDVSMVDGASLISSNPHGTFFDLESHIRPRIWWVSRNVAADPTAPKRISYLDIDSNQLVSFALPTNIGSFHDIEGHAIHVDDRGNVFVTDEHNGIILELDLDFNPDGSLKTTINGLANGQLIVHQIPESLRAMGVTELTPHGMDVIVDDQTGEVYVWFTLLDSGRIALLRPQSGPNGEDLYYTWDFDSHLAAEGRPLTGMGSSTRGHALFLKVDDHETPGDPTDDTLSLADPARGGQPPGSLRVFDAAAAVAAIKAGETLPTTAPLQTFQIPDIQNPGEFARTNQTFVDRMGNVFFIDRDGAIGRLDPNVATDAGFAATVPLVLDGTGNQAHTGDRLVFDTGVPFQAQKAPTTEILARLMPGDFFDVGRQPDESGAPGLNLYDQSNSANNRINDGPFRGTINAGSVLFGSVQDRNTSSNDVLTTNIFAETVRRQVDTVATDLGGRFSFLVTRDGHLVVTGRGDGELVDRQVDLTASISGAMGVYGDVSAVADANGILHVFGRSMGQPNAVVEYRFTPAIGWSFVGSTMIDSLAADPTAFFDSTRGAGVAVTTGAGELFVYYPDFQGGQIINLSASATDMTAGQTVVYSQIAAIEHNGRVRLFGTNQAGGLIEYSYAADGSDLILTAKLIERRLADGPNVLQDVNIVSDGANLHLFATFGSSLRHVMIAGNTVTVRNITNESAPTATGYYDFQQPFAARVYSGVAPVYDSATDTLYVYGVNGRDLVEFSSTSGGTWTAGNLTNDINKDSGPAIEANKVFGAPAAYILPNGDRHILLINKDGDLVEYYRWAEDGNFHTQNITLAQIARSGGNSSLADLSTNVLYTITEPNGTIATTSQGGQPQAAEESSTADPLLFAIGPPAQLAPVVSDNTDTQQDTSSSLEQPSHTGFESSEVVDENTENDTYARRRNSGSGLLITADAPTAEASEQAVDFDLELLDQAIEQLVEMLAEGKNVA